MITACLAQRVSTFITIGLTLGIAALGGCRSLRSQDVSGQTITVKHAAVASVSKDASEIGRDVLRRGGNAVDAAVATAFALAVTFPEAGNIGGGGFMLIRPGDGSDPVFIDYREMAPGASTADMFAATQPTQHLLVGVPGTVRGLEIAHEKFGTRPWRELVMPAVALARDGFLLNQDVARSLNRALNRPGDEAAEMCRVLGKPGMDGWRAGDRLVQPELADTLQQIADHGPAAFYEGPIARDLAGTVRAGGGIITTDDLARYEARLRTPMRSTFRDVELLAPPPPSSGGVTLILMLNLLEHLDLRQHERWSPEALHLIIESMRRAYADRARHLGDPDFVEIPAHLTTKQYAAELATTIDPKRATKSENVAVDIPLAEEGEQTTHFSVLDPSGMAVSNTYTLERSYGGRVMVRGRGFLLNNEMGDFNPRPGHTDRTGRIGTPANVAAPGKRMLSSMTPVIVTRNDRPVLITGSPGGRTIINTVLQVLLNRIEYNLSPADAVASPRLSHQWFPDVASAEQALLDTHPETIDSLKKMGHTFRDVSSQGDAHSLFVTEDGTIHAIADERRSGTAAGY